MKFVTVAATAVIALVAIDSSRARAQSVQPTARTIAEVGNRWVSGIIETRNGRFIIYAAGDSIFIRNRQTGATNVVFARVVDLVVNALGSSAAGDRIVFTSRDDQGKGPYAWTLSIDTLTGRPVELPRRVGVLPAADPSLSPDGRRIAFVERNPSVSAIRGAVRLVTIPAGGGDPTVLLDVTGKGGLRAPRWSADGSSIYYQLYPYNPTPTGGPSLWRIPAAGGRADSLGRVNLFTDVSPDRKHLALFPMGTNWQGTTRPRLAVTGLDGKTLSEFQLPLSARPYSWSRTGASRILAVQSEQRSAVKLLSLADGAVMPLPVEHGRPRSPRYSPNGARVAYQALAGTRFQFIVRDIRAGTNRVVNTASEPENVWLWSPDGAWIAFVVKDDGNWLHVVNVSTGAERRLVALQSGFTWRSDSKALLYAAAPERPGTMPTEVHAVTVDGRTTRAGAIPHSMIPGDWISLMTDTTFIFRHEQNGVRELSVVSIASGAQRTIYTGRVTRSANPAVVSPDGRWVAFSANGPNGSGEQVVIASLDGRESRRIGTPLACGAGPAAWHPDGRHILVWGYPGCEGTDYREVLYLVSLNGDAPRRLTDGSGGHGEWSYSLSPDGQTVLFETPEGPESHRILEIDVSQTLGRGAADSRSSRRAP